MKAAKIYVDKEVKTLFMFQDNDNSGTVDFEEFLSEEAKNIIGDRHLSKKESLVKATTDAARSSTGETPGGDTSSAAQILTKDQIEVSLTDIYYN